MKVLFIQEVNNIAKKGEVKEVAAGYAENFLLPRKLALVATPAILKRVERENARRAADTAQATVERQQLSESLTNFTLKFHKKSKKGKLFGAITKAEIVEALSRHGLVVDKKALVLERPIKMLGEYTVGADFGQGIQTSFFVVVLEEE